MTAWAVPVAVVLILAGRWLLGWFGPQFQAGYPILVVLVIGQTVDAITGAVGLVMTMGGLERVVARTRVIGLAMTAALLFYLNSCLGRAGCGGRLGVRRWFSGTWLSQFSFTGGWALFRAFYHPKFFRGKSLEAAATGHVNRNG